MALRRPPTRLELKTDDMVEYDDAVRERMSNEASSTVTTNPTLMTRRSGTIPSSARERIGLNRQGDGIVGESSSNRGLQSTRLTST
jgi:Anaphase-promoting complex APC subunit CDC26